MKQVLSRLNNPPHDSVTVLFDKGHRSFFRNQAIIHQNTTYNSLNDLKDLCHCQTSYQLSDDMHVCVVLLLQRNQVSPGLPMQHFKYNFPDL